MIGFRHKPGRLQLLLAIPTVGHQGAAASCAIVETTESTVHGCETSVMRHLVVTEKNGWPAGAEIGEMPDLGVLDALFRQKGTGRHRNLGQGIRGGRRSPTTSLAFPYVHGRRERGPSGHTSRR